MPQVLPARFVKRTVRIAALSSLLAGSLLAAGSANAALSFTYNFVDNNPGAGFYDAGLGGARQAAVVTAGNKFSSLFGGYFTNSGTIDFDVTSTISTASNTLASAFSEFVYAPGTFGDGEVIRNKLITGTDLNLGAADGAIDVNWGYAWELDYDTPAVNNPGTDPLDTYDLYATMFHELTHALGFGSEVQSANLTDRFSEGGPGSGKPGSWSKWDEFLTSCSSGDSLVNSSHELDTGAVADAVADGGCFMGTNAVAANGGPVRLFPDADQSHLDETIFGTNAPTRSMMVPERDYGPQEARDYSAVEVGILTDLGYARVAANSVPEPASIALVLVGLAGLGLRRRRKA